MENIESDESRRNGAGVGAPVLCAKRQELVTKNIGLAYHAREKIRKPKFMSWDEWEAECLYVLVKSAAYFDFEMGFKFSTYYMRNIMRQRKRVTVYACAEMRDIRRTQALPGLEKDGSIMPGREERVNWIDDEFNKFHIERIRRRLPHGSRMLELFELRLQGKTFNEISVQFGCAKQNVEQLFKRLVKNFGTAPVRKTLT